MKTTDSSMKRLRASLFARNVRWYLAACLLCLFVAAQCYGYNSFRRSREAVVTAALDELRLESGSHRRIDEALAVLRDYWRLSTDDDARARVLALREATILRFRSEPLAVLDELAVAVRELPAADTAAQEMLDELQRRIDRLAAVYRDHSIEALAAYSSPPWYMQPGAVLASLFDAHLDTLLYNRALYLSLTGAHDRALAQLRELRENEPSPAVLSRILYLQARIAYAQYESSNDARFLAEARQHTRQSVRTDPHYGLPKLFLDYQLAHRLTSSKVDAEPERGVGDGEGEGERGAISNPAPQF